MQLAVAKFDVWARRGAWVVWGDDAIRSYDDWLKGYAEAWLEHVGAYLQRVGMPVQPCARTVAELRIRLVQKTNHWSGEARRRVVDHLNASRGEVTSQLRPLGDPDDQAVDRKALITEFLIAVVACQVSRGDSQEQTSGVQPTTAAQHSSSIGRLGGPRLPRRT